MAIFASNYIVGKNDNQDGTTTTGGTNTTSIPLSTTRPRSSTNSGEWCSLLKLHIVLLVVQAILNYIIVVPSLLVQT